MKLDDLKSKIGEESYSIPACENCVSLVKRYILKNNLKTKKAAIISNFMLKGLGDCLAAKSFLYDVNIDTYEGEYGQWRQEIMGRGLHDFKPDIIYIILDCFGADNDLIYNCFSASGQAKNAFNDYLGELVEYVNLLKSKTGAKIVVSNIPNGWHKILGVIDNKQAGGLGRLIKEANLKLEEEFMNDSQVLIFDFDGWLGYIGKEKYWYDKFFFLADMKISPEAVPLLAEELASYLIPLSAKTKKCLVLDLDNTLWGGIIGEDGLKGIKLSPSGEGRPFYIFQRLILGFYNRGVILALNSKNNADDVAEVFKKHPSMILKEEHFAAARINWQDKVTNFKELAKELNIGLEAMVFIDDDPANRALVKERLPQVSVIDLPSDPALYHKALLSYKGFSLWEFTAEDRKRGKMYRNEHKRKELKNKALDLNSFLRGLDLKITIEAVSDFTLPRAAQLTQKTNQFNFTTRRYQEEDLKKMLKDGCKIWLAGASDKFGDYGLIGLIIVKNKAKVWEIDTFLLSCRILGRRIEEQFLGFVLNELKKIDAKTVLGEYIATPKNGQTKQFYARHGFKKTKLSGEAELFQMDLKSFKYKKLDFIKIEYDK